MKSAQNSNFWKRQKVLTAMNKIKSWMIHVVQLSKKSYFGSGVPSGGCNQKIWTMPEEMYFDLLTLIWYVNHKMFTLNFTSPTTEENATLCGKILFSQKDAVHLGIWSVFYLDPFICTSDAKCAFHSVMGLSRKI